MDSWILTLITFIPLLGAVVILFIPRSQSGAIKWTAVGISFIPLVLSILLWSWYNPNGLQFPEGAQFMVNLPWIVQIGVRYLMGVDGISVPMVFLTTLLVTLSLIYSLFIENRSKEYFWLFLLLETGMLGTFMALDFFLFYVFWELTLVPMYFLIGIWGGPRREYAAIKFFLYTLVGSVVMLLAILAMYFATPGTGLSSHTFSMLAMADAGMDIRLGSVLAPLVFWGLFLGFAIKVPIWPFHTWLPDAHVEAPTAGSVILAGVLLKMGTYGFLRVLLPILPDMSQRFWMHLAILALISIIYGALVAMAQKDLKKLIAYSSVNHMGYVILGIAAAVAVSSTASVTDRAMALNGAMLQMFNHGVITGALFLLVGVIYERAHTRDLDAFGGLWARVPIFGGLFLVACFASLGLPGLSGFVGELFVFRGAFASSILITALATIGIVITAAYLLWTIQRVLLGPANPKYEKLPDADTREVVSLAPLMALMIAFGIWPKPILDIINTASTAIARMFG
ncbi:MAG TPA: NADH-quinone oxidoreductase subunit M [Armatimonadota bacterium]|nr:NADH-quinone oxidoreductase subunit M [Armatimonadota bacterium]